MMPSLMGADDGDFPPKTEHYLFIGGPKHGQRVEVIRNDSTHKIMAPSQPPAPPGMVERRPYGDGSYSFPYNGGFDVHTYVKRELGFADPDTGEHYRRHVYVHEGVPNAQVAEHLLMSALLADFVKGGERVGNKDDS